MRLLQTPSYANHEWTEADKPIWRTDPRNTVPVSVPYNLQHPGECDGQLGYSAKKLYIDLFNNLVRKGTFEARKIIACQFIKSVYVYLDYTLEIEFNVSFEDFKTLETRCGGTENEEVAIHVTA